MGVLQHCSHLLALSISTPLQACPTTRCPTRRPSGSTPPSRRHGERAVLLRCAAALCRAALRCARLRYAVLPVANLLQPCCLAHACWCLTNRAHHPSPATLPCSAVAFALTPGMPQLEHVTIQPRGGHTTRILFQRQARLGGGRRIMLLIPGCPRPRVACCMFAHMLHPLPFVTIACSSAKHASLTTPPATHLPLVAAGVWPGGRHMACAGHPRGCHQCRQAGQAAVAAGGGLRPAHAPLCCQARCCLVKGWVAGVDAGVICCGTAAEVRVPAPRALHSVRTCHTRVSCMPYVCMHCTSAAHQLAADDPLL